MEINFINIKNSCNNSINLKQKLTYEDREYQLMGLSEKHHHAMDRLCLAIRAIFRTIFSFRISEKAREEWSTFKTGKSVIANYGSFADVVQKIVQPIISSQSTSFEKKENSLSEIALQVNQESNKENSNQIPSNPFDLFANLSLNELIQAKEPNTSLDEQKIERIKPEVPSQKDKNINTQPDWSFISSFNANKHGIPTPNIKNYVDKFPNSLRELFPKANYFGLFQITRLDFQSHAERFKKFIDACDKTLPVYILIFRYGDNILTSSEASQDNLDLNNPVNLDPKHPDAFDLKNFNNKDQKNGQVYPILNLRFTNRGILEDDINRSLITTFINNQNLLQ